MQRVVRARVVVLLTIGVCGFLFGGRLTAQQRQALQARVAAPAGAKLLGRMQASQQLDLAISLPLRQWDQLNAVVQQLEDPASPSYHKYLTVAQFSEQFGPTSAQYQKVIEFAQSHGLTVTRGSANRALLNVTGSVSAIEQTFGVRMQTYQHPTEKRVFFAPDIDPTVDSDLPILSVSGLTNFKLPHSLLAHAQPGTQGNQTGSGQGGQFLGSDFRAAYYGSGPLTATGQALALIEFGQWNMADVQAYFDSVSQTNNVPIVLELTGGTSGACPGACNDGEEANDVIQILSMAPGASALIVYEDTSNNADINMFNAYATDNIAKQISMSFGIGDGNAVADEQAFAEMHAQGQNFFVASGDEGANLGDGGWPGFSPDITGVGGTDLTTTSAGGTWLSETGWVGSGTGWCDSTSSSGPCYKSAYDAIPSYQQAISGIIGAAGGSKTFRNLPDVSADANTDSWWCATGTCQGGLGGTSLAAPRWAGFLALANEQAAANGETLGFLNPLVYAIGQGSSYDNAFHDIISGSNPSGSTVPPCCTGSFTATTGFDMVTGWGTPNGQGMIEALAPASTTNPYFSLSALPATLNLTPGGAPGTATISLNAGNGFTGSVTLSANIIGAPTGVTASFNPTSISGSATSTLSVSTTSSSPPGTQMLVVTGSSSTGIGTQPAFVALAFPDFSLSVAPTTVYTGQPNSIYLDQGGSTIPTVTINSENNFAGAVNFAVSGLPVGVTGSFSPNPATTSSGMMLTANGSASTGTNYLTVSGTSDTILPLNAPYTILSVSAATGTGGAGTPVDLSSAYNLPAIYTDGITFGTGMDGAGFGYSSNLLTQNRILDGIQFNFGPAGTKNCTGTNCTNDAVSSTGQVIPVASGQFTTLQLLATAIDGPILSQAIKATYSDGTSSSFTQNFSDWCGCSSATPGPGQQPNESFAVVMPYRDGASGTEDNRVFNLYAYTFPLNSSKTVQSLTLPGNKDVIVLAATLAAQSLGMPVDMSSQYNTAGIFDNGITFPANGGMDGGGNGCSLTNGCADGYSSQQLNLPSTTPPTLTIKGLQFDFGPVNATDCTTACFVDMINLNSGVTITLPSNQQTSYTTLTLLGTGVQGSHTGKVTVNYASGAPDNFTQTFSDWCNYQNASGNESIAIGGMNRINSDGTLQTNAICNLYSYTYSLDSSRTVQSIALANTDGTNFSLVLALTLSGNVSGTPSFTLSAAPGSVNVAQGAGNTSTITVSGTGGFNGNVQLSVTSTLPSGVTASFNPNPATSTSTLTLSASSGATVGGPAAVTISGTSGGLSAQTTSINLTVTAPSSYSISAGTSSPATISPGSTATSSITVTPVNGYTGIVTLSCAVTSTVSFSPSQAYCSFGNGSPVDITSGNGTATLTFSTQAASATLSPNRTIYALLLPFALVGGLLIAGSMGEGSRTKRGLSALFLCMMLSALVMLPGCGSSSSNGGGGVGNSGTPAGTYTITITGKDANGAIQSNTAPTVTITVN